MGFDNSLFPESVRRTAGLPPISNRSAGGRKARKSGNSFESIILASQNDAQGPVVVLDHIKNFAKIVWYPNKKEPGAKPTMHIIQEPSPYDFAGSVFGTGRGIFFDAKSCGEGQASLAVNNVEVVKPHQIIALENQERAGAIAGFLIRSERVKAYLWLPASLARRCKPIRWDDPAFILLGPIEFGRGVQLRNLIF